MRRFDRSSLLSVLKKKNYSVSVIRTSKSPKWPNPVVPKSVSEKSQMLKFSKLVKVDCISDFLTTAAYPQRLIIFHAGTKRTAFLGMLKVFTVVTFGLLTFFQVPKHYYAEDQPSWVPGAGKIDSHMYT